MKLLVLLAALAFEAEVAQLGDRDPAVRRRAQRIVLKAGEKAVPALQVALKSGNLEARREAHRLVDRIFMRWVAQRRKNPYYDLKKTASPNPWELRKRRNRLLRNRARLRDYSVYYRGVLEDWEDANQADYNALLVTLTGCLRGIVDNWGNRDAKFEWALAADAMLWKMEELQPGIEQKHWTTVWAVREKLLPPLRRLAVRGPARWTKAQRQLLEAILRHLRVYQVHREPVFAKLGLQ